MKLLTLENHEKHYSNIVLEILARTPESVLDIGGGTGEVVKFLEGEGVNATCMEVSKKCWSSRVTDNFILHDALETPWPFTDKQFHLCTGFGFLKYIPEQELKQLLREMARVTQKGLFGVGRGVKGSPSDFERTDVERSTNWYLKKFAEIVPSYPIEVFTIRHRSSLGGCARGNGSNKLLTIDIITKSVCGFLVWDGKLFGCSIYETRPEICESFCEEYPLGLENPRLVIGRRKWGMPPLVLDDGNLCRHCANCCSVTPPYEVMS